LFLTLDAVGAATIGLHPKTAPRVVVAGHAVDPASQLVADDEQPLRRGGRQ
jgi:hypothetical protein